MAPTSPPQKMGTGLPSQTEDSSESAGDSEAPAAPQALDRSVRPAVVALAWGPGVVVVVSHGAASEGWVRREEREPSVQPFEWPLGCHLFRAREEIRGLYVSIAPWIKGIISLGLTAGFLFSPWSLRVTSKISIKYLRK